MIDDVPAEVFPMTARGSTSGRSTCYVDASKVSAAPIDMADVQSVEVIKGPSTALCGRLVNVVIYSPQRARFRLRVLLDHPYKILYS